MLSVPRESFLWAFLSSQGHSFTSSVLRLLYWEYFFILAKRDFSRAISSPYFMEVLNTLKVKLIYFLRINCFFCFYFSLLAQVQPFVSYTLILPFTLHHMLTFRGQALEISCLKITAGLVFWVYSLVEENTLNLMHTNRYIIKVCKFYEKKVKYVIRG